MSTHTRIVVFPDVIDTKTVIHKPNEGQELDDSIAAIIAGPLTLQFYSPGDALNWLKFCRLSLIAQHNTLAHNADEELHGVEAE